VIFAELQAWTRAHPFKSSALVVALSLVCSLRFASWFGITQVLSGALLFAVVASIAHCWSSGVFSPRRAEHASSDAYQ
jgi:hypothetical protein